MMVVYSAYEAPDEAEYLRSTLVRDPRPFTTSLSDKKPVHLSVWTVFLDATTHRGADMTAQPLRAGVKATVELENSNPAIAEVVSSLMIDTARLDSRFHSNSKPPQWAGADYDLRSYADGLYCPLKRHICHRDH